MIYEVSFRFARSPEGEDTWQRISPADQELRRRRDIEVLAPGLGLPGENSGASIAIKVQADSPLEAANEACSMLLDAFVAAGQEPPTLLVDVEVSRDGSWPHDETT